MLRLAPGIYYSHLFFMDGVRNDIGEAINVLGLLFREDAEPNTWDFVYRFRYYTNDDPFDETDRKNWYEMSIKNTPESAAVRKILDVFNLALEKFGGELSMVPIHGDHQKAFEALQAQPWAHLRQIDSAALRDVKLSEVERSDLGKEGEP